MSEERAPPSIEGYRILSRLGHGSMGTVWRAIDRSGRAVAVKLADRAKRIAGPQVEEMFRREALVALNLHHPNLVRGLDVGETTDGRPFLSMEFVEGETLGRRWRDRGPLPERDLVEVGRAVAAALEHAHALGLLHRDVKPDNVMILPDGQVKLVDWSLAVERGHGELGCGSPGFASPEMIRKEDVGPASDLYALGVTLAVAALGRPYFQGADVKAVLRQSLTLPLELPESVDGAPLSEGFRAVVARLGRKDPAERYGSAGEVRLDFEALARGQRPLGAYLGLARLRSAVRPARWLFGLAGATALIWLVVLATSRSTAEVPPRAPNAAAPSATRVRDRAEATDPRVEVVLLYVDAHPTEFRKAREMIAERLAASPSAAGRARLEEASRRVEERFRASADQRLAERTAAAKALAAAGDLGGAERALSEWPSELAGAPQEAEAKTRAAALREEVLAPGRRLLEEGEALLARAPDGAGESIEWARELATRIDEELERAPHDPSQRPRLVDLRSRVASRLAAAERGLREEEALAALSAALERADAGDGPAARSALEALAASKGSSSEWTALLARVLAAGRSVDAVLASRLRGVAGKPWAGVVDGRWYVGRPDRSPPPSEVFAPAPNRAASTALDAHDLRAAEPDAERAASWLFLVGRPDVAAALAPDGGDVRRVLAAAGRGPLAGPPSLPWGAAWEDLARRMPFLLRLPGSPAPPAPAASDALLVAWLEAIRSPRRAVAPTIKPSPALLAARSAFLDDDLLAAWTALEQAAVAAPIDPEVAILRSRVLDALAKPARTVAVSLLALSEARRAWDLDPSLPASARLVAEGCLRFLSNHPGAHASSLLPLALAACEEAARLGRADASILAFLGERRLEEGRTRDAVTWLRRAARDAPEDGAIALLLGRAEDAAGDAKRAVQALERARDLLGARFPPWATEMLARLSKR
jgi:tetratricopeptide (TPR) repeat protein